MLEPGGMILRKKVDKNGAIWCILSVPKYVIINQKIQMRTFVQNKYIQILQVGSGSNNPTEAKLIYKNEGFSFLDQILHTKRVYSPVMMWIQIYASGSRGMSPYRIYFIKMVQSGAFSVFQNTQLLTFNQQF